MSQLIQDAALGTDLDAAGYRILNLGGLIPPPSNLCAIDDPRLSDARAPLDGSVTDASVASGAGITQDKLNLNGVIPTSWLDKLVGTAAPGDLAEYISNKGQPNGYASLDGSGKVPAAQMPVGAGFGTVTSVGLALPKEFTAGSPVTGAGNLTADWISIPDQTWFGNISGTSGPPEFLSSPIPIGLIPGLPASQITSGMFPAAMVPIAIGLGGAHEPGLVPDPGPGGGGALATDYLARDMTYKPMPIPPSPVGYQPNLPDPVINVPSQSGTSTGAGFIYVIPQNSIGGVSWFFSTSSATGPYRELVGSSSVTVQPLQSVWFYAARAGYNNSNTASYTNPNPS